MRRMISSNPNSQDAAEPFAWGILHCQSNAGFLSGASLYNPKKKIQIDSNNIWEMISKSVQYL